MEEKKENKKEIKKDLIFNEKIIMDGETVLHHNNDMIITNLRVIKHDAGKISKFFDFFSEDYQDIRLKDIVSIKINEKVHMGLVKLGTAVLLLAPFLIVTSQIEFITDLIPSIVDYSIKISNYLIFFSIILFVMSILKKNKVLYVLGLGGSRMEFHKYAHDDMLLIRKNQYKSKNI